MIDTAHIHVMIVHLPIMGTVLAMIPLIWWFWKRDSSIQFVWLVVLGISLLWLPVAMGTGEETLEAFSGGAISPELDAAGANYALLHYQAAEIVSKIGYAVIILVVGQILSWNRSYRHKNSLYRLTLLINLILILWFSYVGYLGGQIRHPEFRTWNPITSEIPVSTK